MAIKKLKTKKKRLKRYRSRYQAGGMYADNTVSSAGQGRPGSTSSIVYQESDPRLQEQRVAALEAEEEKLRELGAATEQEVEQMKEGDKAAIAAASQDKIGAGVGVGLQAADMGIQSGVIPTKKSISAENPFASAMSAYKGVRAAKKTMKTVQSFNKAKTAFEVSQRLKQGESAYKLAQSMKNVKDIASTGINIQKGATALKGAELATTIGKEGYLAASQGTQALAKGSAIGAGLKSFATSGAGIGTIASLAGAGVSKWADDDDATTMTFGEGTGATLSGIGTGIGAAATTAMIAGSTLGPVGTLVGAGLGAVYGLGKGLIQRKKARREETARKKERTKKVGEFNTKLKERFGSQLSRVRAGEMRQKTYSGYDLGRNLVAQMGGIRMGMPRYGYAA